MDSEQEPDQHSITAQGWSDSVQPCIDRARAEADYDQAIYPSSGNGERDRQHSGAQSSPIVHGGTGSTRRDPRDHYQGFSFVFATDVYHDVRRLHGSRSQHSVVYLAPLVRGDRVDNLPPVKLPYFFVGFSWEDVDGQSRSTSRVEVCRAWQVAFNQLLFYGSFLEDIDRLSAEEVQWCKDRFSEWNDLFVELDQALDRVSRCEQLRYLPTLTKAQDVSVLANPYKRTSATTPLDQLSSTFLAAVDEIIKRSETGDRESIEEAGRLERRLSPWEPCRGQPVVHATSWSSEAVWPSGASPPDASPISQRYERQSSFTPSDDGQ